MGRPGTNTGNKLGGTEGESNGKREKENRKEMERKATQLNLIDILC